MARSLFALVRLLCVSVSLGVFAIAPISASAQSNAVGPDPMAMQIEKSSTGLTAHNDFETVELTVCADTVIHVVARSAGATAADHVQSCPGAQFQFTQSGDANTLSTGKLSIALSASRAQLSFNVPSGALLRDEPRLPRTYQRSDWLTATTSKSASFSIPPRHCTA